MFWLNPDKFFCVLDILETKERFSIGNSENSFDFFKVLIISLLVDLVNINHIY